MYKPKRARIQDVAKLAGVSNMTVSRVLNKDVKVSESKKIAVLNAVNTLNYRPNVSARRLASHQSFFIGLLYIDSDTSYVSKFLFSSLKKCRASGHHLVVDEIDRDIDKSLASVKELIDVTQVDGIILLPPISDNQRVLDMLSAANVPFVRIAPDGQYSLSPYICIDEYQAGFDITEKLIKQGHRKIGHIIGDPVQGSSKLRYKGFLDALRSNQISVPPEYIEQGLFSYDSGLVAAQKLLSLDDRPTAIFSSNDEMAAAVISVAHIKHIRVPEELSVAGFDDGQLATTVTPHLTTIRQPIPEMAKLAIEIIAQKKFIHTDTSFSEEDYRHVLDFDIIERSSTKAIKPHK